MGCGFCKVSEKIIHDQGSHDPTVSRITPNGDVPINYQRRNSSNLSIRASQFVRHRINDITEDYTFGDQIGIGAFGVVKKAIHKNSGNLRAIKTIRKSVINNPNYDRTKLLQEIEILKTVDHPNIVKLYEFYEDSENFHLVTEYMGGGELFDYILISKQLNERTALHFMRQILEAVNYCHNLRIAHRDLKPENLLLDSAQPDATLKVIDFGTSTLRHNLSRLTTKQGTPYYVAPEIMSPHYDQKCDIWSCGVILYVMLSGRLPFSGKTEKEILQKVRLGVYNMNIPEMRNISNEARAVLTAMLTKDPKNRPNAGELLEFQ